MVSTEKAQFPEYIGAQDDRRPDLVDFLADDRIKIHVPNLTSPGVCDAHDSSNAIRQSALPLVILVVGVVLVKLFGLSFQLLIGIWFLAPRKREIWFHQMPFCGDVPLRTWKVKGVVEACLEATRVEDECVQGREAVETIRPVFWAVSGCGWTFPDRGSRVNR